MKYTKGLPREARRKELVAIDTEFYKQDVARLHRPHGMFACMSITMEDDTWLVQDTADLRKALERVRHGLWAFHNAPYDIRQLRRWVNIAQRPILDIHIMEKDMYAGYYSTFSLEAMSLRYENRALRKDIREKFGGQEHMTKEMENYAATDALVTYNIAKKQLAHAEDIDDPMHCYWEIDEPAIWSIIDMPPVKVDVDGWLKMVSGFKGEATRLENELGINTYSAKQVIKFLEPIIGRTLANTDADGTLLPLVRELYNKDKLAQMEVVEKILRARTFRQAVSTYGDKWIEKNVEEGGLVYCEYLVCGAATGRTASRKPNLQNIPVRKTPEYRKKFISRHTRGRILVADVSQQEPRITASLSGDRVMLDIFRKNKDIYKEVARTVFGTAGKRTAAKPVTLGAVYGLSAFGLALQTDLDKDEAEEVLNLFFQRFRGVQTWIDRMRSNAKRFGFVKTASGRRYWTNEYSHQRDRNAVNSPVQGTGGEQLKIALNIMHKESKLQGLPYMPVLIPHDEICLDVPPGLTAPARKLTNMAWLDAGARLVPDVPMKVEIATGTSWGAKGE